MWQDTRLIQRLRKPHKTINPFNNDITLPEQALKLTKNVFSCDYMGAAEFEWGAIPTSLKNIWDYCQHKEDFSVGKIDLEKTVYYLCRKAFEERVIERIKELQKIEWCYSSRLKENPNFKESLKLKEPDTVGWLELDNDFIFFIDEEMFQKTCKLMVANKRDNTKQEGKQ